MINNYEIYLCPDSYECLAESIIVESNYIDIILLKFNCILLPNDLE